MLNVLTQPEYDCFHCFPKAIKGVRLVKDDDDARMFKLIIANTCIKLGCSLMSFGILQTHVHYVVGFARLSEWSRDPLFLAHKMTHFAKYVNRAYGKFYRQKYNYIGILFLKNKHSFVPIPHADAFARTLTYVHNNATYVNKYPIFEDDPHNSYNYYLAAFIQNPEVQNLPQIQDIRTSPDNLTIFNAMDLEYAIKHFGNVRSLRACVAGFVNAHHGALLARDTKHRNTRSTLRYEALGLLPLLQNKALLQIAPTKGHQVKRFVTALTRAEVTRENIPRFFHAFSALFPWHAALMGAAAEGAASQPASPSAPSAKAPSDAPSDALRASYARIRVEHKVNYDEFIRAMAEKANPSIRFGFSTISRYTGATRDYIKNLSRD